MKDTIFKFQLLIACFVTILLGMYEYEFIVFYMEKVPQEFEKGAGIIGIIIMISVCLVGFMGTMYFFQGLETVISEIKQEYSKHKK